MSVFISTALAEQQMIIFHAGCHEDVIKMPYASYKRLVRPTIVDF